MDALKILSRSVKKTSTSTTVKSTPSAGQNATPQLFSRHITPSRKRKRGQEEVGGLNFFGDADQSVLKQREGISELSEEEILQSDNDETRPGVSAVDQLSVEKRKSLLRQHKLKVTWLNSSENKHMIYPAPLQSFTELQHRYNISKRIVANVLDQGYSTPTEVQLGSLPILLDDEQEFLPTQNRSDIDLLTVAPTGSGKTLAFMIPLLHKIARRKNRVGVSGVVLAPTKELVGQIVNEGKKLSQGTGLRIIQLRKGMKFGESDSTDAAQIKADVLVSTPGLLSSIIEQDTSSSPSLAAVESLVLDEADVLLDPLFRDQTLAVWHALTHTNLHVSLWSATMGSNIEELARSTIEHRRKKPVPMRPLIRLVVGLKDSAVPNVEHKLTYAATEQGKLLGLRQLLHPTATSAEAGPALKPPFLVFTQTIERAVALHSELLYDIPVEAGGISRIAVLHSDLSDAARDGVMTRFRKGEIWVLITTDLLSRGIDFRGINGVVNYDIPTSSAAYVHRVGRTGRAGRQGGVAVTLYSKEDIPYLKHVANIVSVAEKQKGVEGASSQSWLFDALPSLSKNDKQKLRKRGIESRTSRGAEKDPKSARRARISTKPGFARRQENNRKGAISASRSRRLSTSDVDAEEPFTGFD